MYGVQHDQHMHSPCPTTTEAHARVMATACANALRWALVDSIDRGTRKPSVDFTSEPTTGTWEGDSEAEVPSA